MKKRGKFIFVLLVLFFSLSLTFVSADALDNAYNCTMEKAGDCSELAADQVPYVILALGNYEKCPSIFLDNSLKTDNMECWPKDSCTLKDTAIALLVLNRLGKDTTPVENWLLNQTKTASDLIWILQIDSDSATSCTINYGGSSHSISINEDKEISADAGSCLTRTAGNYWLQIGSQENCLNAEYQISCDNDFSTTLLFRSQDSSTIHVTKRISYGSPSDFLTEKINYKCFTTNNECDYEGSLWAARVLNSHTSRDATEYLPYLEASAQINTALFPETFLYYLTGDEAYYQTILNRFRTNYWQVSGNRFYDSALALFAVPFSTEAETTKDYFLSNPGVDGCFSTLKDTALLLYSGWPLINPVSPSDSEDVTPIDERECETDDECAVDEVCINYLCVPDDTPVENRDCLDYGFYCLYSLIDCVSEQKAGGEQMMNYLCPLSTQICCSDNYEMPSCSSQGGNLCDTDEYCPAGEGIYNVKESNCCRVLCEQASEPDSNYTPSYTCEEIYSGTCKSECSSNEKWNEGTCPTGEKCCVESGSSAIWWILGILIILIILTVLGIIYKDKLKVFLFKFKKKDNSSSKPKRTLGFPPRFPPRPPHLSMSRPIRRPMPSPRARRPGPAGTKSKDFQEALKKLKEMDK